MPKFLIRFKWVAKALAYSCGTCIGETWSPVCCSGWITEETTREEVDKYLNPFVAERNNDNSKLTDVTVQEITEEGIKNLPPEWFWLSKTLSKATGSAIERFRQNNC